MVPSSPIADTSLPAASLVGGWLAELELEFALRGEATVLVRRRHVGPLRVQRALYEEGPRVCQAVVVHPPGGIAGGDRLTLDLAVAPRAHAMITTPGAAKWYRSAGPHAHQAIAIRVADAAVLEWLPQESILFNAARACVQVQIELTGTALFMGWDITCFGRTACGERFEQGELVQSTRIVRGGRALFAEYAHIGGDSAVLESKAGLASCPVSGVMLAAGPDVPRGVLASLRQIQPACAALTGVTALPGVVVARFLGYSAEEARGYFVRLWCILRLALTGVAPHLPRIWRC